MNSKQRGWLIIVLVAGAIAGGLMHNDDVVGGCIFGVFLLIIFG